MLFHNRDTALPLSARIAGGFAAILRNWRGWLGIAMLFAMLDLAIISVEISRWVNPQPPLTVLLLVSIITTVLLVRTRLRSRYIHLLLAGAGIIVTVVFTLTSPGGSDSRLFGSYLTALVWLTGWLSAWALVRRRRSWPGVAFGALIVFVNLAFLPGGHYLWFTGYFLLAAGFIVLSRLSMHPAPSGLSGQVAARNWRPMAVSLLVFIIAGASIAWLIPQPKLPQLQNAVAARTLWLQDIEDSSFNLFARVPAKKPISTRSTRQDLKFGGSWPEKNDIEYVILSDLPSYWRTLVYDTYTSDGWGNSPLAPSLAEAGSAWIVRDALSPGVVTYTVIPDIQTDVILVGGMFVSANLPYVVYTAAGDVATITAPRLLNSGEGYTVTADLNTPSSSLLAEAGIEYPRDISRYVALPGSLPTSVRALAREVTAGAETPYEKVMAIDDFLNDYRYDLTIDGPPPGTDGVAYFLLDSKSGFCTYFASSMAVMLRAVDVPTRLAVGYVPGDPGEEPGTYIVRSKHAHAWVQVYFPGTGWVDIEATPGGDDAGDSPVPIETPLVSQADIAQLSQWDIWGYPEYPFGDIQDGLTPSATPSSPVNQKLFFADQLGLALLIIGVIMLALLALSIPVYISRTAFNRWLWNVDRENVAAKTFLKMVRLAAITGLTPAAGYTPGEFADALAVAVPEKKRDIDIITRAYEARRYGRAARPGLFEEADLLKARCSVYDALLVRLGFIRGLFSRR